VVGHIANAVAIVLASGAGSPSYPRVKMSVMGSHGTKAEPKASMASSAQ
jgi:hypothetical protein